MLNRRHSNGVPEGVLQTLLECDVRNVPVGLNLKKSWHGGRQKLYLFSKGLANRWNDVASALMVAHRLRFEASNLEVLPAEVFAVPFPKHRRP